MYVILAQVEGYPIILGRPWLIAMNARQDWEKGTLVLKPSRQKLGEVVVYSMKSGRQECLEVETSEESESSMGVLHLPVRIPVRVAVNVIAHLKYVGSL